MQIKLGNRDDLYNERDKLMKDVHYCLQKIERLNRRYQARLHRLRLKLIEIDKQVGG